MGDPTAVATTKGLKELSSAERFAILKRLDDALEKDGEYVKFKNEATTDSTIAAEFSVSETVVHTLRRDTFGSLKRGLGADSPLTRTLSTVRTLVERMEAAERRLDMLENTVTEPPKPQQSFKSFADLNGKLAGTS